MDRTQKAAAIAEVAADIEAAQAVYALDFRGLTVAEAADVRGRLRDADATLRIVKNTLTERSADQAGTPELKEHLVDTTALAFVRGDAAAAAKVFSDFNRASGKLAFKGGTMNGKALSAEEIGAIARLPSREALYGQLVGTIAYPISGLARTLNALIGGLAIALGQVAEQKNDTTPQED